jgi:hypothetical protein
VDHLIGPGQIDHPKLLVIQRSHAWIQQLKNILGTPHQHFGTRGFASACASTQLKGSSHRGRFGQTNTGNRLQRMHICGSKAR